MAKFIQERLRPISLPRGRCLDKSAEATEGEVKALRAVAGSLSLVARQCRPDEAGLRLNLARFGIPSRSEGSLGCQPRCESAEANRGRGTSDPCDSVG